MGKGLARAGWRMTDDGLRARLPTSRALPAVLLVLVGCGVALFARFMAVTYGPRSWWLLYVAAVIAFAAYCGLRGLLNKTDIAFSAGVFRCESGALWPREEYTVAMSDLVSFEGRPPSHFKDVAHVVAHLRSGNVVRLPIPIADTAIIFGPALAKEAAEALDAMLDTARRTPSGYRAVAGGTEARPRTAGPPSMAPLADPDPVSEDNDASSSQGSGARGAR